MSVNNDMQQIFLSFHGKCEASASQYEVLPMCCASLSNLEGNAVEDERFKFFFVIIGKDYLVPYDYMKLNMVRYQDQYKEIKGNRQCHLIEHLLVDDDNVC